MDDLIHLRRERRAIRRALKNLDKRICEEYTKYVRGRRECGKYEPPSGRNIYQNDRRD